MRPIFFIILKLIPEEASPCSPTALLVNPKVSKLQLRSPAFRECHSRSGQASQERQPFQPAGMQQHCLLHFCGLASFNILPQICHRYPYIINNAAHQLQ